MKGFQFPKVLQNNLDNLVEDEPPARTSERIIQLSLHACSSAKGRTHNPVSRLSIYKDPLQSESIPKLRIGSHSIVPVRADTTETKQTLRIRNDTGSVSPAILYGPDGKPKNARNSSTGRRQICDYGGGGDPRYQHSLQSRAAWCWAWVD